MSLGASLVLRFRSAAVFGAAAIVLLSSAAARAATITVTTVADDVTPNDGSVSLREAITAINAGNDLGDPNITAQNPGVFGTNDTINFNIGGAGVHTITPASNLPALSKPVFINGYSQPGSAANTNPFPQPLNATILIELNGTNAGGLIVNAPGTTIRGLAINRTTDLIDIVNGGNVTIAGNYLGSNTAGTVGMPSVTGGFGVRAESGTNNHIGGPAPADRNLISGNTQGGVFVGIPANDSTLIQGNFIGPDVTGTVSLNPIIGEGVIIRGSSTNAMVIGNLISGNKDGGLEDGSLGGVIQGNLIGTQRDGVSPLPNGNFGGVFLAAGGGNLLIGGAGPGQPNVIAMNNAGGFGIVVLTTGNTISRNSIYGNTFKGISLNGVSQTPLANDNCDVDTGPGNEKQNYPVITSAVISAGTVTISGTLNSAPSADFVLEFFSNAACDASGNGQGQTFIGSANVTTPVGNCNVNFGPLTFPVPPGQTIFTATANDFQNTSEFSACFPLGVPPPTSTPSPIPTPTPTVTGAPSSTPTPGLTSTPIPTPQRGGAVVPTLSPWGLALFAAAIAAAALLLVRRT